MQATIELIKKRVQTHQKRKSSYRKRISETALLTTKEFLKDLSELKKDPSLSKVLFLGRDIIGNYSWVTSYFYKYTQSLTDFSDDEEKTLNSPQHQFIIDHIQEGKKLNKSYSDQDIFESIFLETRLTHLDHSHFTTSLKLPKIKETIVLVSGVFNEMFKQAAFERGVQHVTDLTTNKYIVANVSGSKSSKHNSLLIKNQLDKYIEDNPNKKLWIIAYSKGGVDFLHYLKANSKFANKHISGITMVAVPVLGTTHFKKLTIKLANFLLSLPNPKLENFIAEYGSIFSPEFQQSLNGNYRRNWFKRNHQSLPKKIFYSSIAFHAKWKESHVWMRLTKVLLPHKEDNDGIVESCNASFPDYFRNTNFGIHKGHHLVGFRSSSYSQEALLEALTIFHHYKKMLN